MCKVASATGSILYDTGVAVEIDSQAFTVPLIAPGAPGLTKRTNRSLGLETPQLDTDTTLRTLPKLNALENVICTDVLPWPDVICAPLGAVHSYDVTPATGEMVYVTAMFWPTNSTNTGRTADGAR